MEIKKKTDPKTVENLTTDNKSLNNQQMACNGEDNRAEKLLVRKSIFMATISVIFLIVAIILVFPGSKAWFADNKQVGSNNLNITVNGQLQTEEYFSVSSLEDMFPGEEKEFELIIKNKEESVDIQYKIKLLSVDSEFQVFIDEVELSLSDSVVVNGVVNAMEDASIPVKIVYVNKNEVQEIKAFESLNIEIIYTRLG